MSKISPLIVVGMHRSGTSAVCRLLEESGYYFGDNLIPAAEDNPLGFWEDKTLVFLNQERGGAEDSWQYMNLPQLKKTKEWKQKASEFLRNLNEDAEKRHQKPALKDPRICRFLGDWLEFVDGAKVLFVIRNPVAVANSLSKRNHIHTSYGLALWFVYNFEAIKSIIENSVTFACVDYDQLMANDYKTISKLYHFIDKEKPQTLALEAALRHNVGNDSKLEEFSVWGKKIDTLYSLVLKGNLKDIDQLSDTYNEILDVYTPLDKLRNDFKGLSEFESHLASDIKSLNETIKLKDIQIINSKHEIEALSQKVHSSACEIADLQLKLDNVNIEKSNLISCTLNFSQQLEVQSQSNKELLKANKILLAKLNDMTIKYGEIEKTRWEVDELLLGVYRSKSWKITKPLRDVAHGVRAVLNHKREIVKKILLPLRWVFNFGRSRYFANEHAFRTSKQNKKAIQDLVDERASCSSTSTYISGVIDKACELPIITLSVVTYNNGQWLENFFDSLMNQSYPLSKVKIIFVDNSSTDGTYGKLAKLKADYSNVFFAIELFQRPNLGFGCGHDYAIRHTGTDYVLVSNVDLEFEVDSIYKTVLYAISDENSASWEFRQSPYEHPKFVDPITLHVNWSSHACILMDRKGYLAVGGYEKKIFMYGEDVELSYRFRRAGYKLTYLPSSVVYHYTYEEASEVKPLQFVGSITSNFLIRCRYGKASDIFIGGILLTGLIFKGAGFKGSRGLLLKALPKTITKAFGMVSSRRKSQQSFPFRAFDYDLTREGAFWESSPNIIGNSDVPLITVITRTVAGREGLLRQTIQSVVNQTYFNIEHIIVEDGGDACLEVCEELIGKLRPGYTIRHIACEKKGRSHAANKALESAKGYYLLILDDDDLILPDHLETLYTEIVRNDVDGSYSLAWDTPVHYIDKPRGRYTEEGHITLPLFYQEFDREILSHHNYLPIQSVLFKRKLYDLNGGFDEDMDYLEDWIFWYRLTREASFVFVKKTTSLFKTPASVHDSYNRKLMLDNAYYEAKRRMENLSY